MQSIPSRLAPPKGGAANSKGYAHCRRPLGLPVDLRMTGTAGSQDRQDQLTYKCGQFGYLFGDILVQFGVPGSPGGGKGGRKGDPGEAGAGKVDF